MTLSRIRFLFFIGYPLILLTLIHPLIAYPAVKPVKTVLLVLARQDEANPIIQTLQLRPTAIPDPRLPMKASQGKYKNISIGLIVNGIDPRFGVANTGTQAATLATYVGIQKFHPDLIISIGIAGGAKKKGAHIGDIYLSNKIFFFDRRLSSPAHIPYGLGGYPSPNNQEMANLLNIKVGIVCSGDSFDADKTDKIMLTKLDCSVKDMEAAGVAWVSMLTQIPMYALKGITDHFGVRGGHDELQKNLPAVTQKLALKIGNIIIYLSNKNSSQKKG